MNPVKALGRTGMFGKLMNNIDGGVEVLDDLNDHWTAKNHKQERSIVIEDLQDLAIDKSLRVTILRYVSWVPSVSPLLIRAVATSTWLLLADSTPTRNWDCLNTKIRDICQTSSRRRSLTPLRRT